MPTSDDDDGSCDAMIDDVGSSSIAALAFFALPATRLIWRPEERQVEQAAERMVARMVRLPEGCDNAELLALSGPRNPYQQGPLGVIKEGAYADLILVNGNPLENLDLVADADKNFDLIMKDGNIYKNNIE